MDKIKDAIIDINRFIIEIDPLLSLFLTLIPIIISIVIISVGRKNNEKKNSKEIIDKFCSSLIEIKKMIGSISFNEKEVKESPNNFLYENYIELRSEHEILKALYYTSNIPKKNANIYQFIIDKIIPEFIDTMGQIRHYYGKQIKDKYLVIDDFEVNELIKGLHLLRVIFDDAIERHLKNLKSLYSNFIKLPNIEDLNKRYHEVTHRNLVINNVVMHGYIMNNQFPEEYIRNLKIKDKGQLFKKLMNIMEDEDKYSSREIGKLMTDEINKSSNLDKIVMEIVSDEERKKKISRTSF